jgi:hypothetical protein
VRNADTLLVVPTSSAVYARVLWDTRAKRGYQEPVKDDSDGRLEENDRARS